MENPVQTRVPNIPKFSLAEQGIIQTEINNLLRIGAIETCQSSNGEFISQVFARPKPSGKVRLILNLKPLNVFVKYEQFKLEHLEIVKDFMFSNDWLCSLDLANAYFSIPIHEDHRKFLTFVWRGIRYRYKVVCFGLASAPRLFTRIMKPIMALFRGKGLRVSMFLDVLCILNRDSASLLKEMDFVVKTFQGLGFQINYEKSVLKPCQNIVHLGFMLNSVDMNVALPTGRIINFQAECKQVLEQKNKVQIRKVARLVGIMIAYNKASYWGRLFVRHLEDDKIQALKRNCGNFDAFMTLSHNSAHDVSWWLSDEAIKPSPIHRPPPVLTCFSDSSKTGWGDRKSVV
jgi:hypothetical protein